jgi:steroid 5-alpha reductase family enzyme
VSDPDTILWASAAGIGALMLATWGLSLHLSDVSIVDVAWGLGFILVAWIALAVGDGNGSRSALVAILVSLWGLRLAGYLAFRKLREPGEDFRYAGMRERAGARFPLVSLGQVFVLQGAALWVVSLPVQASAASEEGLGALEWLGVAVWAVGLFFEAVGDWQLARFKADPANRTRVMDRGLWRYTRHPNYFGDFGVWWGLYLIALGGGDWWTIVSPILMSVVLLRITGKEPLERSLRRRRPGYEDYVRRTSGFFPLPPGPGA